MRGREVAIVVATPESQYAQDRVKAVTPHAVLVKVGQGTCFSSAVSYFLWCVHHRRLKMGILREATRLSSVL